MLQIYKKDEEKHSDPQKNVSRLPVDKFRLTFFFSGLRTNHGGERGKEHGAYSPHSSCLSDEREERLAAERGSLEEGDKVNQKPRTKNQGGHQDAWVSLGDGLDQI